MHPAGEAAPLHDGVHLHVGESGVGQPGRDVRWSNEHGTRSKAGGLFENGADDPFVGVDCMAVGKVGDDRVGVLDVGSRVGLNNSAGLAEVGEVLARHPRERGLPVDTECLDAE